MSSPVYLVVLFDLDKPLNRENAMHEYVERRRWETLQSGFVKHIDIGTQKYEIKTNSSFQMGDFTGQSMVLILHIEKIGFSPVLPIHVSGSGK